MAMDGPVILAIAALAGSLVGACSSVTATFLGQRLQARWNQLCAELKEREELYGIFVEEAVHLFADSIQRSAIEPAKIMRFHAKLARIRLTSTDQVLHAAEEVGKRLIEAYELPRRIQRKLWRDMPGAKPTLIRCEGLQRLAGWRGPKPFNRSELWNRS